MSRLNGNGVSAGAAGAAAGPATGPGGENDVAINGQLSEMSNDELDATYQQYRKRVMSQVREYSYR